MAIAAVIAACAGPGATNVPATAVAPTNAAPATPTSTPPSSAATVAVRTDAVYGAVLTGTGGKSLYLFTNDTNGKSACAGNCAGTWPPLTVASASALAIGTGVTGVLGTITRDDGSIQVTIGGVPLYYYAGDSAAGDTKGQKLFDKWYLVSPAGTAVKTAGGGAPAASTCSGPACY